MRPMAISRRTQDLLAKADLDSIENDFLGRLSEDPDDLDYFVGVARALVGHAADEQAQLLLEMMDEQLRQRGAWRRRLDLLRRGGAILCPEVEELHARILDTLRELHGHRSCFEGIVEAVGLHRAPHDIPKTWEKAERLESLVVFDRGVVVRMEGKGAGTVAEVNFDLQSFRVDFERHPGLMVGFRAAPKMMEPLTPDHVLYRKLAEPEALAALARDDPPQMLRAVLHSYGRPMNAGDVRRALAGVVDDGRWTSWWAAARKHPQVVTGGGGRQTYTWAESSEHATESVWQRFEEADPRKRIELLRREGARDPELARRMEAALAALGEKAATADPGLAFELFAALERGGAAPEDGAWTPAALCGPEADARRTVTGIQDRALKERAYRLVRELREDWLEIYLDGLGSEEDPRTLSLLSEAVAAEGDPRYERFLDGTLTQPHRAPAAFVWLAETAAGDEALRARNPLRLLQQILSAPARPELAPYRVRLLAQCESGGAVPRLLPHLTPDDAPLAEEAIHRAPTLEPYQREDLTAALHLRFPALRRDDNSPLYALVGSIEAKRAELKQLLEKELPANRKAIEEARAMGDLRENFEYKSARQRHEYLTARATELKVQLERARPLDLGKVDPTEVRVGTRVELALDGGERRTVTLLGPWESDPEGGVISFESELGQALLGKKVGEAAQAGGTTYTVGAIARAQV